MKIALMAGSLTHGGTERVVVTLAENFIKRGHEVTIVTPVKAENEFEISPSIKRIISDLTPEEMGGRIANIPRRWNKLKNIWLTEKPDAIVSFIGRNNFSALISTWKLDIPVAVCVRADPKMEYETTKDKLMMKFLYPRASKVVLQTKDSIEFFPKAVQKKVVILKNPLNPEFLEHDSKWKNEKCDCKVKNDSAIPKADATENVAGDVAERVMRDAIENVVGDVAERVTGDAMEDVAGKRIVAVGRIDSNKNHEMLIRAFLKIADDIPEYSLEILGDGDLRQQLLSMVNSIRRDDGRWICSDLTSQHSVERFESGDDASVRERISLPGVCRNVADRIANADIFVLCSNTEGVPNTLLEAMALGIPAISTDCPCGGPKDIIRDGENGFLVPVGDVDALADCIYKLANDDELMTHVSQNELKTAEKFREDVVVDEWLEMITKGLR